jgi:hypothetical protein
MSYQVECVCGKSIAVTGAKAGGTVDCVCGATVSVPKLSDLQNGVTRARPRDSSAVVEHRPEAATVERELTEVSGWLTGSTPTASPSQDGRLLLFAILGAFALVIGGFVTSLVWPGLAPVGLAFIILAFNLAAISKLWFLILLAIEGLWPMVILTLYAEPVALWLTSKQRWDIARIPTFFYIAAIGFAASGLLLWTAKPPS